MENDRIQQIIKRMDEIYVKLDPNPIRLGPSYIHEKLTMCSDFLQEIENIFAEIFTEEMDKRKSLNQKEQLYQLELEEKLAKDPEVRKQKSMSDREAFAKSLLRDLEKEIHQLETELLDLSHLKKIINLKNKQLKRANSDIRLQNDAIKSAIKLGTDWSDKEVGYTDVNKPNKMNVVDDVSDSIFRSLEEKANEIKEVVPKNGKVEIKKEVVSEEVINIEDVLGSM
jgi:hypothetical protein